jgi:hypothetical protein
MAVLNNQDRSDCHAELMRDSRLGACAPLTKAELRAAINDIDDFFNTNATTINNAIPVAARSALTTQQKALLLVYVISKRYLRS